MKNISITEAETQIKKILDKTVLEHEVFLVDGSYGKSIIISESSFNTMISNPQNYSLRVRKQPRISLQERFKGYTGDYKPSEVDWDSPVG